MKLHQLKEAPAFIPGMPAFTGHSYEYPRSGMKKLENVPTILTGHFNCSDNSLKSLLGGPQKVKGNYIVSGNKLTSLEGIAEEIGGTLSVASNPLGTLAHSPKKVDGSYYASFCGLKSLVGATEEIGGGFNCYNNQLTSLEGVPRRIGGGFDCSFNKISSFKNIHKQIESIDGDMRLHAQSPYGCSDVLGVILIKGVKKVTLNSEEAQDIINKYLGQGMDGVLRAQEELIDAGFEDYARL